MMHLYLLVLSRAKLTLIVDLFLQLIDELQLLQYNLSLIRLCFFLLDIFYQSQSLKIDHKFSEIYILLASYHRIGHSCCTRESFPARGTWECSDSFSQSYDSDSMAYSRYARNPCRNHRTWNRRSYSFTYNQATKQATSFHKCIRRE